MANTILTPTIIAKEALLSLYSNAVMARLVHRDYSKEFAKVGDSITVRDPATFTADEYDRGSGLDVQDITEGSITIAMDTILDVSFEVTSEEMTLDIDEFSERFIGPAMETLAQEIDTRLLALALDVPYYHGTAGTAPSTVAEITGTRKVLNEAKAPVRGRRLVLDPAAEAELLQLSTFHEADKVGDQGSALREGSLGRKFGFDTFMDQNIATSAMALVDTGADAAVDGAVAAGETSITVDGTNLTGTWTKGSLFTVAGADGTYVVTADAAAAANEVTATFYPAAPAGGFADDAVVTLVAAHTPNIAFHRNAFALVTRPLALPAGASHAAVEGYKGFGLRVVADYDIDQKADVISIDCLLGVKTIKPELAARLLG